MATTVGSDGSLQKHAPNDAEAAILSKCQTQSLLVGGMYMGAGLVGIRFLGPTLMKNAWKKSKMTRRSLYAVGGFFGFSSGVASYTPRCAQMLMELDDSPIADELRKHMAAQQSANVRGQAAAVQQSLDQQVAGRSGGGGGGGGGGRSSSSSSMDGAGTVVAMDRAPEYKYGQQGVSIDRNSGAGGSRVDMDRAPEYKYGQQGVSIDREHTGTASASRASSPARATRDAQQDAPAAEHPFATKSLAAAAAAAKAEGKPQEREVVDMLTMKKVKVLVDENGRLTPIEDKDGSGARGGSEGSGYMARARDRQRRASAAAARESAGGGGGSGSSGVEMDADVSEDKYGNTVPAARTGWRKRDIGGKEVAWANSRGGGNADSGSGTGTAGGGGKAATAATASYGSSGADDGNGEVLAFSDNYDDGSDSTEASANSSIGGEVLAFPDNDGGWNDDGSSVSSVSSRGGRGGPATNQKLSYAERREANRAAMTEQQEQQALERRRKRDENREQTRARSREQARARRVQQEDDGQHPGQSTSNAKTYY